MKKQAFQHGEIRDADDNIIQEGVYGKHTAFVDAGNNGILDCIINNLEVLHDAVIGDYVLVTSKETLPTTGDSSKVYMADDTGKVYRWNGTEYVEMSQQSAQITAQEVMKYIQDAIDSAQTAESAKTYVVQLVGTAKQNAKLASDSKDTAVAAAKGASESAANASQSEANAAESEKGALSYCQISDTLSKEAKKSAQEAADSAAQAQKSADIAEDRKTSAINSATASAASEANAKEYADQAANSAATLKSKEIYANVGGLQFGVDLNTGGLTISLNLEE